MLDFNSNSKASFKQNDNDSLENKIKSSIKKEISGKTARNASFLTLASVLSACNFGGSSDSIAPLNISAIKGPLSNALAFVDRDGDGVHDDGEEFAVTSSTGSASITPNSAVLATDKLVITSIAAGQTIGGTTYTTGTVDTNTGGSVADLVLKAPSNSTVVTPVTTLVAETGLSESAVKEVLGLPAEMDVLNFNPFAENLSEAEKTVALEAEKVALKVYTTVSTIQASAKSSGLDAAKAFATAIEAVGDVVKEQSAAGAKADLADSAIIDKVVTKTETVLTTKLEEAGFDAAAVTAAVNANKAVLATAKAQIKTVNDAADAITSFDATELGAIAKLAVKSGEEAAAAVTAEKANPGSGAAAFTMKTADAVASAKAEAKAEVQTAKGETVTTTTTASEAVETPFVLTSGTTVDWAIDVGTPSSTLKDITTADSTDATYTVSGSTMTINMGQAFSLEMVQALLTENADLTFALSLSSLPTSDDTSANTTTVTITEGSDSTISSGEGQIRASVKSTYKATSTTQTDFTFTDDPISISYTPRSGNSDVTVSITNPSPNFYSVGNDGNFNNNGGQAILELMATKFFTKLDAYSTGDNAWAKTNIMSKFVTANTPAVHISIDTADLGLYNGSTKINKVETTLSIGNNPTTGGVLSGTARTGATLTVTKIADLDDFDGNVTWQWQKADSSTHSTETALANNSNWTNFGSAVTNDGSTGVTYTIPTATTGSTERVGDHLRVKATYTDKQGNSEVFYSNYTAAVETNNQPGGAVTISTDYSFHTTGSKLTATNNITDADGIPTSGTGAISYIWQSSGNGSDWTDITGATSSTYTIATDLVGKQVRAVAKFTDNQGTQETVASTPTAKVVKDYFYFEKVGTASTSEAKIAIYLDQTLLPTSSIATINTKVESLVPKFKMANVDLNSDGDTADTNEARDFSSYFEQTYQADAANDSYYKITDAHTPSASLSLSPSDGKSATLEANATLINLLGQSDISGAAQQYKIAEISFNPKDTGVVGQTIAFQQVNSQYAYNGATALEGSVNVSPGDQVLDAYEFYITF